VLTLWSRSFSNVSNLLNSCRKFVDPVGCWDTWHNPVVFLWSCERRPHCDMSHPPDSFFSVFIGGPQT
ncbi:hypothetical protein P3451_22770, partial [Vibrio parahaemolyticus]|nr:hypothetical protein [Vibrio parahaemolyticus]